MSRHHRNSQQQQHSQQDLLPMGSAKSLVELRRRSSARGSPIKQRQHLLTPTPSAPPSPPAHLARKQASDSSQLLVGPTNYEPSHRKRKQSSSLSYRDLSVLRKRAATIRIVSDSNDSSQPPAATTTTDSKGYKLVKGARLESSTTIQSEPGGSSNQASTSVDKTANSPYVVESGTFGWRTRRCSELERKRYTQNKSHKHLLNVEPAQPARHDDSSGHMMTIMTRAKSQDYTALQQDERGTRNESMMNRFRSEAAICEQPRPISSVFAPTNSEGHLTPATSDNQAPAVQQQSTRLQNLTTNWLAPTVAGEAQQEANINLHRLSVENFQQFGAASNVSGHLQVYSQPADHRSSLQTTNQQELRRKSRLDSRGHINPQLMASMALWPARASMMVTSGGDGLNHGLQPSRRPSQGPQDFVRRASDWSRMSMSTNLDLRRLLRLWAHTNPYQARRTSGTGSCFSQSSRNQQAFMQQQQPQPQPQSPNLSRLNSRQNSPRPSSVGSTRQAYELMSAFSRNHDLYYGYEGARTHAINPLDDQLDQLSIGWRDKCLAYSLSCLDLLCIWECCSAWLAVQKLIAIIVFDPFTELFIILCILINTLFMALDSNDADSNMKTIFERGNYFFTATFAVEASMKIMALSPKFYFREGWNVFDSIIVGLSLLELGLEGVYGLSVLRSFRLLRVFKLAKSWPTLNLLISIMGKAVGDLGNLTFVLAIIVFIFAVMGMQLFGGKYLPGNFPSGQVPRWNFTDFMHSFMIVFRILCAEWIEPMWDCLLVGGWPCIPFFLIAVTVGNLVVLNLFLALLLASFGASNLSSPQADNVDTKKLREAIDRFKRFGRWLRRFASRLLHQLAVCFHLKRAPDGINDSELDDTSSANCGRDHKNAKGSHIVAMSRCERKKNIELRTEELKSRIKKSPEQHYHLKQLARQSQQVRESHSGSNSGFGYNFNYPHHHSHQHHNHQHHHYHHHHNYHQQHVDDQKAPVIPIIVNEAPEEEQEEEEDGEEERVSPGVEESVSLHLDSSSACTSPIDEPILFNTSTKQRSFKNMQPIREDSHDSDSNSLIVTEIGPKIVVECEQQQKSSSLDKLASDEMLHLMMKNSSHVDEYNDDDEKRQDLIQPTSLGEEGEEEEAAKSSLYLKAPKRENMEEEDERALQDIDYYLERCICIGVICLKWFLFRQFIRKIVEHRYFDQCILVLIVISSGTLALEDKHLNERPNLKWTLDILDTIFTIIFSLEMISKWLAFGIRRYFGNIWSWLDFIIVLVSFINLMASIFGSGKIQALKTMRTLRAMRGLRPLRALQRFQGMRVVVNALIQAIPSIFNVLLVCLIFWLIFSIMGVQMFGGKFWRCLDPSSGKVVSYQVASNKIECISRNLTWSNPQINFDNVLNAYLALFQVATFKGWIDIMNSASDSRNRDEQPIREANIYMYFYFVFFVIFGSFFTLNLFIGVIIDNFNEQKKKTGGSLEIFMTDDQKKYYHAMKKMRSKRPIKAMTRPKLKLQAYVFDVVTSKKFDMVIMLIIGLNMFIMALEYYGQSVRYTEVLELLNLVFIAIFTLESLCKIFAMRHFYFREPWNLFDFVVVVLSLLGVLMKEYVAKYFVSPTLLRVVRVVKVGRVLRLVKGAKGIRTLLFALAMSLPALFNICLLLFLVMFIYAIFGMSFFMNVRPRAAGWDLVLDPLMDEENDCQRPDPAQGIEGTCGNKTVAIVYLISYVIVTFLIIINMYIAVILENYSQATEDVQEGLTDDDYEMYYEVWQKFDPDGTQYIPHSKLSDFVDALEDPLRIPKPNDLALVVMDINIYQGDRCYCVDILDGLTKFFFTRKGLVIQVNEHLQKVQSSLHETAFERITTTYMMKRENYCARVIQNCWRKWKQQTQQSKQQQSGNFRTVIKE